MDTHTHTSGSSRKRKRKDTPTHELGIASSQSQAPGNDDTVADTATGQPSHGASGQHGASNELSPHLQSLVSLYDQIDVTYCFLLERKIKCTLTALQQIVPDATEHRLCQLKTVVDVIVVGWCDTGKHARQDIYDVDVTASNATKLEVKFKRGFGGKGKVARVKRRAKVLDMITQHMHTHGDEDILVAELPAQHMSPEQWCTTGSVSAGNAAKPDQEPFNPDTALAAIKALPLHTGQVVHEKELASRTPTFATLERPLPAAVAKTLEALGIRHMFSHQVRAIDAARRGEHVVVSTSTSSGKSLVYNSVVFEAITQSPQTTAMYMFPTKALAQDQLRVVRSAVSCGYFGDAIVCRTYDGDSTSQERHEVAVCANIIMTNPDILHHTVIPHHEKWQRILRNLRFLVIDEAHTYRGLFGSHVSAILSRLVRVCHAAGNQTLQFICCSATLANPADHCHRLLTCLSPDSPALGPATATTTPTAHTAEAQWLRSKKLTVVDQDGSARGRRVFALWNPQARLTGQPLRSDMSQAQQHQTDAGTADVIDWLGSDGTAGGAQPEMSKLAARMNVADVPVSGSPIYETAMLLSAMVKRGVRTLVFCKIRKLTELVLLYAKQDLGRSAPGLASKVKAYRAGYTKEDRRELERALFDGRLLGVTATCALELGVDIGSLDCTILLGYPGSISSMWQQAGRSGRSARDALTFMILFNSPVEQYIARNPDYLFNSLIECATLNPANSIVMRSHALCAAGEFPLIAKIFPSAPEHDQHTIPTDVRLFGDCLGGTITKLKEEGLLRRADMDHIEAWTPVHRRTAGREAANISIRKIDEETIQVLALPDKNMIDEFAKSRAFFECYPGAILLNQGTEYMVTDLDTKENVAYAEPCKVPYYTKSRDHTDVNVFHAHKQLNSRKGFSMKFGRCSVHVQWYGFRKYSKRTNRIISLHSFEVPSFKYTTWAIWIEIPYIAINILRQQGLDVLEGVHAAQHLLLASVKLHVPCDKGDLDTEHAYPFQQRRRPNHLVLFDAKPGGTGIMEAAFNYGSHTLVKSALHIATSCPCLEGCPGCVFDTGCKEHNQVINKRAATIILQSICDTLPKACTSADANDAHDDCLVATELQPPGGFFPGNEWISIAGKGSHIITATH